MVCDECSEQSEIIAAMEDQVSNAASYDFTLGQLRLAITFTTFGIESTTFIPFDKACGETWEDAVSNQWTDIQEALADLLYASSGSRGGFGDSGGGDGSGSGGGATGGGSTTVTCVYTNGVGNDDNHPSCPPTYNPELGLSY